MPRFRLPAVAVLSCIVIFMASGCGRSMERVVVDAENAPSHGAVTLGTLREHAPEPFLAPFALGPAAAKPTYATLPANQPAPLAGRGLTDRLSVLSFNTEHRTKAWEREVVARHLQSDLSETPDFVLLQEVMFHGGGGDRNTADELAKLLNYHVQATKRTSDSEGVAILSRYPFEFYAEKHLKNQTNELLFGFQRVSVMGEFFVPGIGRVRVVNVHLTNWGFEAHVRSAQIKETMRWIVQRELEQPADVTILGGDFNMEPDSKEYGLIANAELTAPLRFEDYNGTEPTRGSPGNPRYRIDYIFVATPGADLRSLGEQRLFTAGLPKNNGKSKFFPSDHVPVLHEFAIGRGMMAGVTP